MFPACSNHSKSALMQGLLSTFILVATSNLFAVPREDAISRTVADVKDTAVAITCLTPESDDTEPGYIKGAGCFIDNTYNLVLTCQHVVGEQDAVGVLLTDGTELVGYVVFADEASDIAVVRVRRPGSHDFKEVRMVSAKDLMLGERAIVIGSPRGYEHTITFGRLNCLSRELKEINGHDLVQTDAAVNPGNSGGPVFNINGELIGMLDAQTTGSQGLNWFIKSDKIDNVLSEKLSTVKRHRAVHGITASVKILKPEGNNRLQLVVRKVVGPAKKAGIVPGDVILTVAGQPTQMKFDIERHLWNYKADDKVDITLLRGGKKLNVTLKMTKWTPPAKKNTKARKIPAIVIPMLH